MPLFFRLCLSLPFKEGHRALPVDWWCNVLGFVPAGSVSSSSTHQIFRDVRHSWWLPCRPVCLLSYYLWLLYIKGSTSTGDLESWCRTLTYANLFFRFKFLLFSASSFNLCRGWHNYVVVLSLPEAMCDYFYCQAGGWDRIGFIVFMDGGRTLFDSETPPWLVFGDWAINVHYETLWLLFSWMRSLISDSGYVLPAGHYRHAVPSQVFWQNGVCNSGAENGLGTLPILD